MRGYMKKRLHSNQETKNHSSHTIPDVQIIDLDENEEIEEPVEQEPERKGFHIKTHWVMHFALLAAVIIVIIVVVNRIGRISQFISQDDIFSDGEGTYDNTFDQILPVLDANGNIIVPERNEDLTILMLGNSPLTDDRNSKDGLANMIADRTGANVINCAVSGSYIAAENYGYDAELAPLDAYTPYWLCTLTCIDIIDFYYESAADSLGENIPPEAEEVFETLSTLDMSTVDVIAFMYDGTDYMMGNEVFNPDDSTDIHTFAGNLAAGIEMIQNNYPHIRIIVMSPAYAFGINENGEYISSDIKTYGDHFLSTYVYMQMLACADQGVTYVDNLYGTINEDFAGEYLTDNIHLNVEGRKLMADRFIYALTYFN